MGGPRGGDTVVINDYIEVETLRPIINNEFSFRVEAKHRRPENCRTPSLLRPPEATTRVSL